MSFTRFVFLAQAALSGVLLLALPEPSRAAEPITLQPGARIALVGGGLGSRALRFGYWETELHARFPEFRLTIRNLCDEGDTPGFRPHSGRPSPWAFPGAEAFHPPLSDVKDRWGSGHAGNGFQETPDQWLTRVQADIVLGFFGGVSSFNGPDGVDTFRDELTAWIEHTAKQRYNGHSAPQILLVSPTAFEDLSEELGTPDGVRENGNLALYTGAMEAVAREFNLPFVDLYSPSQALFASNESPLTRDGFLLTETAYAELAPTLAMSAFNAPPRAEVRFASLLEAVREKNWMWEKFYKIPNGVHVFGRRHRPFGPQNYPYELEKLEEMTKARDQAIWATLAGDAFDLATADAATRDLPEVETNYRPSGKNGNLDYLYGQDALDSFTLAEGYAIDLFASEENFPNLANPVQMSFDNAGRLWIATMPTYPHYQPGDAKPDDKLVILVDEDNDGKADREIVYADGLHLPTGFELAPEGVYVAQGNHLILLRDVDGDDRADSRETIFSGFDDHDTHHVISAFCADPTGAIYMGEGTFLHSNVETAYGTIRSSNGGFFRFDPQRAQLTRAARLSIPNPWGTAFDDWGQIFFIDTSDPNLRWMVPGTVNVPYGSFAPNPESLIENAHRVRPTSGLEFVSSRHFPEEVQGDILLHNTIGFLGTKQHTMVDDGTGYRSRHRQDLVTSSDGNYRPVDLEFAPDGSLYIVDWHNVLVGHMQHSARDPLRDHVHGRIYRITYPSRPLVEPAEIAGASIETLLANLMLPEYRTRYRTRRELRGRDPEIVLPALRTWVAALDPQFENFEAYLLEALWVSWGLDAIETDLARALLKSDDHRARAAAVMALRYRGDAFSDRDKRLAEAAVDPNGRVRLLATTAASDLNPSVGLPIVNAVAEQARDPWLDPVIDTALATLTGQALATEEEEAPETSLTGADRDLFLKGAEVYRREGHCATCHQEDGLGLPAAQFPPLAESEWVSGDVETLIKITLHGLMGPIQVKGVDYPGLVPMTPFKGLSDEEIAAVLTYVRNSFGNEATPLTPEHVAEVREATKQQIGFIQAESLDE